MKLKIGVSSCFFHADPKRAIFKGKTLQYFEQSMVHWIESQGALAFLIPQPQKSSKVSLDDYVEQLDALVLQGGSDISPKSYGETALRPEWEGDYIRDQYEIELIKKFMAHGKPVLGICRGAQILNVAFGGTMFQDIESQMQGSLVHRNWDIYDQNFHQIVFETGSLLEKMYSGLKSAKVNSVHHQGIKDLATDLIVEARSEKDGVIEAIRHKNSKVWVYGVQWHPEFHVATDKSLLASSPLLIEFFKQIKK